VTEKKKKKTKTYMYNLTQCSG